MQDKFRDGFFNKSLEGCLLANKEGYIVLRFWNDEVLENMEGVLGKIKEKL